MYYNIPKGTAALIIKHSSNGKFKLANINDWTMICTTKRNRFNGLDEVDFMFQNIRNQLCDKLVCAGLRIFTTNEWYFCCRTTDAYMYVD